MLAEVWYVYCSLLLLNVCVGVSVKWKRAEKHLRRLVYKLRVLLNELNLVKNDIDDSQTFSHVS